MAKEAVYIQQLEALGVYNPAFDSEIHMLCIQERELSRSMKAWKATAVTKDDAPLITHPLYVEIAKLRRDILARKDALGLTPNGLRRIRGKAATGTSGDEVKLEDLL